MSKQSMTRRLPTLRFRAKIILGFGLVLLISAVSLATAYLGFEKVSSAVASYRTSVSEADLARNIDRELIAYRGLARYYVVTAKDDDAKAAQAAEVGLKSAIDASMRGTSNPARLDQVTRLSREFQSFAKIFAEIVEVKSESALLVQNKLTRDANMLRYKLDDLPSNADDAELQAVQFGTKKVIDQFQSASALANTFVINADQAIATGAMARLKFVENSLGAVNSKNDRIVAGLKEAAGLLAEYGQTLAKLIENTKKVDQLVAEMAGSADAIVKGSGAMKADLLADQQRLEKESDAAIGQTERLIIMLAIGGTLLGAVLALVLGRGISAPMTAMCRAMRELANGNFDVVLPGLGRRDELGEMAGAVEEFKLQAIAKAERDASAQDAQNKAAGAARRAELIRFADDFETAVGAIVSNVSASAGQLEQAAGILTRTADTTQGLSSHVAGASEEASTNIQSVASATEQLSASIGEIGRHVQRVQPHRGCSGAAGASHRRPHRQIVARGGRDRRCRQADQRDCGADQPAGAQRHHRGGARRRRRPRLCGGRGRGEIAGQPDGEGDRGYFQSHRGHAGRHAGVGRRDQGDRRHHRPDLQHRLDDRKRSRAAGCCDQRDRPQCAKRGGRHARGRQQYRAGQPRRHRDRRCLGGGAELGQGAHQREHAAACRAGPVHGEYPGGVVFLDPSRTLRGGGIRNYSLSNSFFSSPFARSSRVRCVFGKFLPARLI